MSEMLADRDLGLNQAWVISRPYSHTFPHFPVCLYTVLFKNKAACAFIAGLMA